MGTNVDWIIHYILDDSGPYPYPCNAHTHGMKKYRHPDFQMMLNLPQEHICYLLNTMGMRVQGGETFHDGDMVSGIYENCSIRLKKVRETGRDILRLIIPDKHNRFPEGENCMEPYRHQELKMFENQEIRYLKKAVWKTAAFFKYPGSHKVLILYTDSVRNRLNDSNRN